MTVQEVIDLSIEKKSNVSVLCDITDQEIRAQIKDTHDCYVFRNTKDASGIALKSSEKRICIVPPAFHDTMGGSGPNIVISSPNRILLGQDQIY